MIKRNVINRRIVRATGHALNLSATVLLLISAGCSKKSKVVDESISDIQKREGVPVRIMMAQPGAVESFELIGGTAEGYFQTTLKASVPGQVTSIRVKVGDRVQHGTSLMRIEPDMAQNHGLATQQFENAEKSRNRVNALAREGGVSQEVIDQVETGYLAAKEAMDAARKNEFVPAPFAGVVVGIFQSPNSKVGPNAPLIEIAQMEKIRIPMVVSDALINRFRVGQKAVAVVGSDSIVGTLEKVSLAGQANTHSFTVEAVFANPKMLIRPAMYVQVRVRVESKDSVLSLPMDAVLTEGSTRYVFVVRDGKAQKRLIETGIRTSEVLEIVSGVASGDSIVVSGSSRLSNDDKVKIVP